MLRHQDTATQVDAGTGADAAPELLIVGAQIADGSGGPLFAGDVLVANGRILAVSPPGTHGEAPGRRLIRASGRVLSPGFIDVHSHADLSPLLPEPDLTKLLQGVTTEVIGNCGSTLAPVTPQRAELLAGTIGRTFPEVIGDWHTFAEFLSALDSAGYVTNVCPLVGHSALRIEQFGVDDRPATPDDLAGMRSSLSAALDAGAFGCSAGLIYAPGAYSDQAELVGLARVLSAEHTFAVHMRNEADAVLRSIAEVGAIGAGSGARMQISHLKNSGRDNWGRAGAALAAIEGLRADGVDVSCDVYPYLAASTRLTACLPPWALDGGAAATLGRLGDPAACAAIRAELLAPEAPAWESSIHNAGFDGVVVASSASHAFDGHSLLEIGQQLGMDPLDALLHVLRSEELRVTMLEFSMGEEDLSDILRSPHAMIASDGTPVGLGGLPHPRLTGTFPMVLGRYVRTLGVLDLPTAIWKMTGQPAATFGVPERGRIRAGWVADLVCFDAERVAPGGGYRDPWLAPVGIDWVMQAGRVVVADGQWCGEKHGDRLLPAHRG